jgi:hypothetical protein
MQFQKYLSIGDIKTVLTEICTWLVKRWTYSENKCRYLTNIEWTNPCTCGDYSTTQNSLSLSCYLTLILAMHHVKKIKIVETLTVVLKLLCLYIVLTFSFAARFASHAFHSDLFTIFWSHNNFCRWYEHNWPLIQTLSFRCHLNDCNKFDYLIMCCWIQDRSNDLMELQSKANIRWIDEQAGLESTFLVCLRQLENCLNKQTAFIH